MTLSTPASSFHRPGLLWIFGYSAFSLWPSACKYKLQHCRGCPCDYLHHFLFPDPSFTQGWPNKDISLDPENNLWGADRGEATEREFYQQQVFQQLVLWNPVEVVDAPSSTGSIIVVNCLHGIALYFSLRFCGIGQVWNKRRDLVSDRVLHVTHRTWGANSHWILHVWHSLGFTVCGWAPIFRETLKPAVFIFLCLEFWVFIPFKWTI